MKKLTAGIFSVLLGLVSAGVANAAVVSTEYLEEVLETELADMQTTMTATGPVKIENNVVSVETGAVSENGTNLVTAADIYAAVNNAVADQQLKSNLVKTDTDGKVVAPTAGSENDTYPSYAAAVAIAKDQVGVLTGGVATLEDDVSTLKTNVADIKDNIGSLGDGVTVESAIATEKSEREAADVRLQNNIDLKANAADVYSKADADKKFEAQEAATAKLQEAKNYTDEQLKTLTEDMWGGGEGSEDQGLQGTVASQALKITALEDKVGNKSVVARIEELDFADAAVAKEFVTAVSQTNGVITVSRAALAENDIPTLSIEKVDGLQAALDAKQVALTGQEGVIVISDGVVSVATKGIGTAQLADSAVTSEKLADNAVTAGKIASDAVTAGTIADGAVEAGNLAAGAVVSGNIANGAVTAGTIAAGAVKNDNISDGELSVAKVDGLQASLNAKFEVPAYTTTTQNGTYVLTATELDGTVTYAWENIAGRTE